MNVKKLALALLTLLYTCRPALAAECHQDCVTSPEGVALIQFFEGYSPFTYLDIAGLPTIGYGHLILKGEKFQEPLLGDAATELLKKDLRRTERGLKRGLVRPVRQNRFDALVSFAFNVGVSACLTSSPLRYTNARRYDEVPARLMKWINVTINGKLQPSKGLIMRRRTEGVLYAR